MNETESNQQDARIEQMLRGHLRQTLDGHVGASSRRFAEHIAAASRDRVIPMPTAAARRTPRQRNSNDDGPRFGSLWSIGLIGAALAATITIVSMRHTAPIKTKPSSTPGFVTGPKPNIPGQQDIVPVTYNGERNSEYQRLDQGIVRLSDGTAARRYLQRRTDTIRTIDPKTRKPVEITLPAHEETIYVGLKQY